MAKSLKLASIGKECVACGCCLQVCPMGALQIFWGMTAQVDPQKCVGCGKCAKTCPAAVIDMIPREAVL
jgi:ferredoxin